ncbi:MAG: hypothetical protein A2381_17015 [Bdellovibrionales bacterium RIFOXYB1_FULL_37_110]|nr:MAG: hypothetical protein A2181_08020 [Bdellovibrionales bacterium RIFOXYA1_FULL_38_20]OFZ50098.1 MAG: hypothetical protein A2417_18850 [Bdellovibrionales bacterium RIFOXYC1_FULL_37_79]OFZ60004.1 MAG: hypothetical protein A2381_17015 [Bdellovibrionales bacterium RIFOXYB1_FULL_37_110]OFZ64273.1 MAG: hypothetical protein A2577_12640 [Bdellovibrionales bacterium RIFOXYD1_FULL_36_51]OFZ77220.1 MAG: hypothetical protein A2451_08940 [Bdellovibrionales bacterium RIFOXYC2_FULL_39_8]
METNAPTLREILINCTQDINSLPRLLNEANAGSSPIILNVESLSHENILKFLDLLYPLLKEINLHPQFPYPIFIMTDKISHHPYFIIIHALKDIPTHYQFKHEKKLTPREISLMRTTYLHNKKIKNLGPFEKEQDLQTFFKPCKILHDKIKELDYFETLLKKINRDEQT